MGLPVAMFPVMFVIPRMVGRLAQWQEIVTDPKQEITRPHEIFDGYPRRRVASLAVGLARRARA
jgi:citrate synthase